MGRCLGRVWATEEGRPRREGDAWPCLPSLPRVRGAGSRVDLEGRIVFCAVTVVFVAAGGWQRKGDGEGLGVDRAKRGNDDRTT